MACCKPFLSPLNASAPRQPAHIGKLTVEQALAEYAALVHELRAQLGHTPQRPVPVVAFSGSYGGWLAAWLVYNYSEVAKVRVRATRHMR